MGTLEVKKFKLIGLDLDGTLYKSTPEIQFRIRKSIYEQLSFQLNIPLEKSKELFETNYNGNFAWSYSGSRTIEQIYRQFNKNLDGSDVVQKAIEQEDILDLLEPNPRLAAMLIRIKKKRTLDVLTSSRYDLAMKKLEKLGIDHRIFCDVISTEHKGSKTDSSVYKYWLTLRGVNPDETLYVGDNPKQDIIASKKLGIRTCIVGKNHEEADFFIQEILDLESLLSS